MEGVAVPHTVEHSPDRHFRARIPLADRGHDSRTDCQCTIVNHLRYCMFLETLVQLRHCTDIVSRAACRDEGCLGTTGRGVLLAEG